jgi:hypothetical protein
MDVAFRFLTAQAAPDFVAISRFRARHGDALKELFTQVVEVVRPGGVGVAGSGYVGWDRYSSGSTPATAGRP